jgi:phospholipid/cholesterol/gamma-HCH transport system substrate-binding protein
MADGGTIALDRTAVPIEWDEVKSELTKISAQLGPQAGQIQGPLSAFVNQAADTLDGNGDSFRQALRELSQTAGRLGDSRTDLFGTVKNLQILIEALSRSNDQIVQFSGHLASVSQVLADSSTDLDVTLGTLNQALSDVRGFLLDNNDALIGAVNKLADFTGLLSNQSDDIEQVLHVLPNALANFYNIYDPAQGTANGVLGLPEFNNPVQFICGAFDTAGTSDDLKRSEICRERMAPVLRRLAVNYPPFMVHPINTITAYKGQVIYDTPATEAKAKTYIPYLQWVPSQGRMPPRPGQSVDIGSMLVPPAPGPGPRPPAQPFTLGPVVLPPGPEAPPGAAPPGPADSGSYPAEGVPPMQPVAPQQSGGGG